MWPDLSRMERPTESTLRGLATSKLLELRELIDQLALAQARKVVVFSQWRRMLRLPAAPDRRLQPRQRTRNRIAHRRRRRVQAEALFTGLFDGTTDEVAFERAGSFLSRIERIVTPALEPATPRGSEAADVEDDAAEREIDAVVTAADESRDALGPAVPEPMAAPSAADVQRLFSGLSVQRTDGGGVVIEAPPETASTLAALFSGMAQLLQAAGAPSPPSLEISDRSAAAADGGSARLRTR
jgi:hypothetical protein